MTAAVAGPEALADSPRQAIIDLRRARRRQRTAELDAFEALYRVYITGIVLGIAIVAGSSVLGDTRVSAATAAHVATNGPQILGLILAIAVAIGARSGGRGGPLVFEAADIRHILLAPVDRTVALRPVAIRQLRFGLAVGLGAGAVGGLLAFRRLGHSAVAWIAVDAVVAGAVALAALGAAMVVSGLRLGRWAGSGIAAAIVVWSGLDLYEHARTSPLTWLGRLSLAPLGFHPLDCVGLVVAVAVAAAGVVVIGGASIEAAERRATMVGQIRFAATLRDLRTVIVLRRQLAQELPRQRPWFHLPRSVPRRWLGSDPAQRSGRARTRYWPGWRRGWHGILRFPAIRLIRLGLLGAIGGAALVGVWDGTTALIVVAALASYVAGLDAAEPLAQEIDHPDRRDEYPLPAGVVLLRQIGAPIVLMVLVGLVGVGTATAITGGNGLAWRVGLALVLPASLAGLAGATISVVQGPPPLFSTTDSLMPPEAASARAMFRMLWPPVVATIGVVPILLARHASRLHGPGTVEARALTGATALVPVVALLVIFVGVWVRYRENIKVWWRRFQSEQAEMRRTAMSQRSQR